ncbi:AAA domain-containing protein [Micromonospora purpureochromogenes]|uniref:Nuclease SbcCD subunit C n=1 Tax=Micromonospora purpureochromogenes TaxID=47872 RepID=A0A1C4YFR1_9ACTN|nr:AAA family ATPase [Micromonospora purpureochromogenes]SCF19181.1 AAA domain-containing protein [Micromonospora purpureochromogenes]
MTFPEQPTAPLIELIFDRLAADSDVQADTAELVLAALTGDDDLTAALAGSPTRLDPHSPAHDEPSERIWLKSVTVAGFRGVGPERTLDIAPGPGLTLVVGRNGSGKSSFAEAVELALTGDSARWADKTSVWRTGWRNLHAPDPCRIGVELRVDGVATPTRVARAWPAGGELADAEVTVTSARGRRDGLTELGLARPLELYRPFLTAAELGRLAAGTQSQLFDALFAILGLDALTDADQRLMRAARPHDTAVKEVRAQRAALADLLAGVADDRARRAAVLLRGRGAVDLPTLTAILDEPDVATADEAVLLCRELAALDPPPADEVTRLAGQLREAATETLRYDGGRSRAALRSAELLRLALEHHEDRGDGPCPVCATGALDGGWRAAAAVTLTELRQRSVAAQTAATRLTALLRQAHHLIDDLTVPDGPGSPPPTGPPGSVGTGVPRHGVGTEVLTVHDGPRADTLTGLPLRGIGADAPRQRAGTEILRESAGTAGPRDGDGAEALLGALREAVAALRGVPGEPADLADHLAARYPAVVAAADAARAYAEGFLRQRDTGWRAAAAELRGWVAAVGGLAAREATLVRLKAARAWLKETGAAVRDERIAPFAAHSQRIWKQLRQESNIELGAMTLAGTNNRRRVVFPVSVDGADNGTALGVMSQGEMQALGLATFLPRSCAPESPFRFIVVDDPVQSMDPSKVDGLARVLAELAEDRQVVVFTHDTRLPDAVRRLDLGRARIVEVQRAERSVVTLRPASDPVTRYLDDAWALARNDELPADVRGPVVAELCRSAVEAACHLRVWRVRVTRGVPHDDIEAAIVDASRRLTTIVALAVFDDADRGGDVLGWLGRHGGWAVGAYRACREGVHGAYLADLPGLVTDARALAKVLA